MGGEIGVFSGGRGKGSTLWFSCVFELPHPGHTLPDPDETRTPLNPFEAVVAYKDECIGTKFSKFISNAYSITIVYFLFKLHDEFDERRY